MRIGYIVNPVAGKKRVEDWLRVIRFYTETEGFQYGIYITDGPGDGIAKAERAVKDGCDVVVAVGGDGTVSEVVNGIPENRDTVLGVLPVGTGNDFARTLKLPLELDEAVRILLGMNIIPCDLGVVNGRYFINVASVGLDSQVVIEANKIKKSIPGSVAYILGVFKAVNGYKPYDLEIQTEQGTVSRQATLIAVANGSYYGGGMKIAPRARINDGLLDICLVRNMPRNRIIALFPLLFSGGHLKRPEVEYFNAEKIKVFCEKGFINSDGDIIGECPADMHIEPNALRVVVPEE
ncbi:MAG: Transcription regulator [contains diacylglycerol kinase catalytic domain] [Firmicutes bacterium]|nr:Transcription regulator [contains diacylglycerol kinase catalytic domain] [Bacillota bacterium]MDI6704992.1 diacylglycerol kinase family lipid kinase [Bacillota bacterium]